MPSRSEAKRLFVFDFDWTLIEADSDNWVFKHLCEELYQEQLVSVGKVQWTDLQQRLLGELFDRGVTQAQIEKTLGQIPFAPDMIEALRLMKDEGSDLYILSDANTIYIETVLKAYEIDTLFTGILTNPASFDERGRLNVVRFHGLDKEPHCCPLPCEPNLCKGQELQKLMDSQPWDQVIYMGDSTNDFCPSTRLNSHDVVLARRGLLLQKEITERPQLVKANVVYWENAKDVLLATRSIFNATGASVSKPSSSAIEHATLPALSAVESSDSKVFAQPVRA
ncbi:pyridoxal phosphate phosphatase PHOSPHO2 [Entomortierella parvispora]|uniref:Pyridoxal phosphate phosphatase PHOSPHO2 n=1 Tax=Entomortierella parvispora TaxID=205924 RepID=A0A9P3HBG7_9FUNG|nr:pyridoxal phosphate phosphatase PHOSPHO2 [Entomortierella parvispora]